MSYQHERDAFILRMGQEGLPLHITRSLLSAATSLQRYAELSCSSEWADRDRVPCPQIPCLCDAGDGQPHQTVPRIDVQAWKCERRIKALLPAGWDAQSQGDPRGYVLGIIPPSYTERNVGRNLFNRDSIGVPVR